MMADCRVVGPVGVAAVVEAGTQCCSVNNTAIVHPLHLEQTSGMRAVHVRVRSTRKASDAADDAVTHLRLSVCPAPRQEETAGPNDRAADPKFVIIQLILGSSDETDLKACLGLQVHYLRTCVAPMIIHYMHKLSSPWIRQDVMTVSHQDERPLLDKNVGNGCSSPDTRFIQRTRSSLPKP
jgi:hypothetical protein